MKSRLLSIAVLVGSVLLISLQGYAQTNCAPISGTIYFWYTDTWHGSADFTIARNVQHADVVSVNTWFFDGGDVGLGTETWTLDFGKGHTVQVLTRFTVEHMADAVSPSGVMHLVDLGTFSNGAGRFKHAYGNIIAHGPFGPSVKLPPDVQPPADATMLGVIPTQGMICGLNDRKEED